MRSLNWDGEKYIFHSIEKQFAWHIPYTAAALEMLKGLFPEVEYLRKTASVMPAVMAVMNLDVQFLKYLPIVKLIFPTASIICTYRCFYVSWKALTLNL